MRRSLLVIFTAALAASVSKVSHADSVTISGIFKTSVDHTTIRSPVRARAGTHTSEVRVVDESSRISFNVVEDLGGGIQAIAQLDWRINTDQGKDAVGGNAHVGLRSKTFGRVVVGRQDLHYHVAFDSLLISGSLKATSISLTSYMANRVAIAGTSRTPNMIMYTAPPLGDFRFNAAYSTSPDPSVAVVINNENVISEGNPTESDIGSTIRRGRAFWLNPHYQAKKWRAGWSYWNSKPDTGVVRLGVGASDQVANRLFATFSHAGFVIGLTWDKSRLAGNAGPTNGVITNERTAWSVPASYVHGENEIHLHYTKANNDRKTVAIDGARMIAIAYVRNLSKRTSLALTYSKIINDPGAGYNFFTTVSLGNVSSNIAAGEDPRLLSATIRHTF
jgi:predicted porin